MRSSRYRSYWISDESTKRAAKSCGLATVSRLALTVTVWSRGSVRALLIPMLILQGHKYHIAYRTN